MRYILYLGRKGNIDTRGIHSYVYNTETERLEWIRRETALAGFTHLAINSAGNILMATGKDSQFEDILVGYAIDQRDASLHQTGEVRLNTSGDICHLDISHDATTAVVTDFINKGIHICKITEDGCPLSPCVRIGFSGSSTSFRQGSSHPHSAFFSADDQYIFVSDLGANRVWTVKNAPSEMEFRIAAGWKGKDGIGQRHTAIHPNGRYIYSLAEITAEVAALEIKEDGSLRQISMQSAMDQPLPDYTNMPINDIGLPCNYICAGDIAVSPDGEYLFLSIRMIREIGVFKILPNGDLKPMLFQQTEGTTRCIRIGEDSRTLFAFDEESRFTGGSGMIEIFYYDGTQNTMRKTASMDASNAFIGAIKAII